MSDAAIRAFPHSRDFLQAIIAQTQATMIPMSGTAEAIWETFGPTSPFGSNPTMQVHIRCICTFLSAVERCRRGIDAIAPEGQ